MKSAIPSESAVTAVHSDRIAAGGWRTISRHSEARSTSSTTFANLGRFESCASDAGLLDESFYFRQAAEFKSSAHAAELANLLGQRVLVLNPGTIKRSLQPGDSAFAERRRGVSGQQVAQRLELEQPRAGMLHRMGHEGHAL